MEENHKEKLSCSISLKKNQSNLKKNTERLSKIFWSFKHFFATKTEREICLLKFIYSEKATKYCEISTVYLTGTT